MDLLGLGDRAFAARLKRELPRWRQEGLIDGETASLLEKRYRLDEEDTSVAAAAIYILGALLVGGGVISFVAWNWADLADGVKIGLLTSALVAAHLLGYRLWRVTGRMPRLGHALMLLGTLVFGAEIGLLAQIYHISADASRGTMIWALGALVGAWTLASVPHGVLAVVLTGIWAALHLVEYDSLHGLLPFLMAIPAFALAWRTSSRILFLAGALGTLWCVGLAAGVETGEPAPAFVSLLLGTALLLAFGMREGRFAGVSRAIGILSLAALAYAVSFHELARELHLRELGQARVSWLFFALPAALVSVLWAAPRMRRCEPTLLVAYWGCFLIPLSLLASQPKVPGAVAANLVLMALCLAAVTSSVRTMERGLFWWGALMGGLVIVSRFLEFETELWLKALVFVGCGVAVIVFGRLFETRRRAALGRGDA